MNPLVGFFSFLVLDAIYLSSTKSYFNKQVKAIQGNAINMRLLAAAGVYVLIGLAWYLFIFKEMRKDNMKEMLLKAFLLGFTTYGIFDLTNHAIFDNWNLKSVLLDTFWGGILYFIVTLLQYKL